METLRKSEQVAYLLRSIYEQYGYRKFRMSKFEEYDFYAENKDFSTDGQVITFTDPSGKLMALKPDITMSVAKNTRATANIPEKVYYTESVYRMSRETREYKEIFQLGLEYIGEVSPYTNIEIIDLALKSLACIEPVFVLDISHMGFITGLFDSISATAGAKKEFLHCIERKNIHELNRLISQHKIEKKQGYRLLALAGISGSMDMALKEIREISVNQKMRSAVAELEQLYSVFKQSKNSNALRLDFSIISDSKYYNGLIFRGYVKSVPRTVLSGGRYDYLLSRMHKSDLQAIGFAIYFDEVERYLKLPIRNGYDTVILYDERSDLFALHCVIEEFVNAGKCVCAALTLPENSGSAKIYRMDRNKLLEQSRD